MTLTTKVNEFDRYAIPLTTNHDLTGATLTLTVAHLRVTGETEEIVPTVQDAAGGVVLLELDGTWRPGRHYVQLTIEHAGEKRIAPTGGHLIIEVAESLD